ncbi:MAG TPA: HD-GYP domain-containing protein [Acidimicrobiia bacterium]|nr:HD-GYP domain-containing protein [Acidimicrobiia bacterium]
MTEPAIRSLLAAIRRAAAHHRIYGAGHELTQVAFTDVAAAADKLIGNSAKTMITLLDHTLYVDRAPMAGISLEFNGMIEDLQQRGIESIIFEAPVRPADCGALAAFLGRVGDPPTGSVVLNEDSWARTDLEDSPTEDLRHAYTTSLIALRSLGEAVQSGSGLELSHATSAVRSLLEQVMSQPEAAFLLTTIKSHHEYTFYHSVNTSILAIALGRFIGLDQEDQLVLGVGALLHDIGKIGVSASILQYPGRLRSEDWAEIKLHPQVGAEAIIAASERGMEAAAVVAFEHHAGFDGAGYPTIPVDRHADQGHTTGKSGASLHLFSRLVAVADTYDAVTTRRAYRRAESPSRALHLLLTGAGRSHDPDFVQAFIGMMGVYPPGSRLLLDDGRIAVAIRSTGESMTRPTAAIVADAQGNALAHPELVQIDPKRIVDQISPRDQNIDASPLIEQLEAGASAA